VFTLVSNVAFGFVVAARRGPPPPAPVAASPAPPPSSAKPSVAIPTLPARIVEVEALAAANAHAAPAARAPSPVAVSVARPTVRLVKPRQAAARGPRRNRQPPLAAQSALEEALR
jgi:hypothetical protein